MKYVILAQVRSNIIYIHHYEFLFLSMIRMFTIITWGVSLSLYWFIKLNNKHCSVKKDYVKFPYITKEYTYNVITNLSVRLTYV